MELHQTQEALSLCPPPLPPSDKHTGWTSDAGPSLPHSISASWSPLPQRDADYSPEHTCSFITISATSAITISQQGKLTQACTYQDTHTCTNIEHIWLSANGFFKIKTFAVKFSHVVLNGDIQSILCEFMHLSWNCTTINGRNILSFTWEHNQNTSTSYEKKGSSRKLKNSWNKWWHRHREPWVTPHFCRPALTSW